MRRHRPVDVTIAIILYLIAALSLIFGVVLQALGGDILDIEFQDVGAESLTLGILFAIAIFYIIQAHGLWVGKRWAWKIALTLSGIFITIESLLIIIEGITFYHIFDIIFEGVSICFFCTANTRRYFAKYW